MNEKFALDPEIGGSVGELRQILAQFGPYSGRYIVQCPDKWTALMHERWSAVGDIELARWSALLRRTQERGALASAVSRGWSPGKAWFANAKLCLKPAADIDSIVTTRTASMHAPPQVYVDDAMELFPDTSERIRAIPEEFLRVSESFLREAEELVFVDPYLDPGNRFVRPVILPMLALAFDSGCRSVTCWARKSVLIREGTPKLKPQTLEQLKDAWLQLSKDVRKPKGRELKLRLVDDAQFATDRATDRLHPRYLFSIKGGVRFDQGFQQLRDPMRMEVGPISAAVHDTLVSEFVEGRHRYSVFKTLVIGGKDSSLPTAVS